MATDLDLPVSDDEIDSLSVRSFRECEFRLSTETHDADNLVENSMYGQSITWLEWCVRDVRRLRSVGVDAAIYRFNRKCAVVRPRWR